MRFGRFQRVIGFLILGAAGGAAALLWLAVAAGDPVRGAAPTEGTLFGDWKVFYDTQAPTLGVLVAAVALAVLFALALLRRQWRSWRARRRLAAAERSRAAASIPAAPSAAVTTSYSSSNSWTSRSRLYSTSSTIRIFMPWPPDALAARAPAIPA